MKNCSIIKCGHSFCKECIENCINLHNKCPVCKEPSSANEIVKDYTLEEIKVHIVNEREMKEKNYSKDKFKEYCIQNNILDKSSRFSNVFFSNLNNFYLTYDSFLNDINNDFVDIVNIIENKDDEAMFKLLNVKSIPFDEELMRKFSSKEEKINHIKKSKENIENSLLNSLDNFLKNLPSNPLNLPLSTSIKIVSENIKIDNVLVSRKDSINNLYSIVTKYFINKGDAVSNINKCQFEVKKLSFYRDINENLQEKVEKIKLDPNKLFLDYEIYSGEVIYLEGDLELKSKQVNKCIKKSFDSPVSIDFYKCDSCNLRWICQFCISKCHKNHTVEEFRLNHHIDKPYCCCENNKMCKNMN